MSYQPAALADVRVTSPFYQHIDKVMRKHTLPAIIDSLKSTGRFYALSWTRETAPKKAHCFWDSDVFKSMEACCYYLMKEDDPKIRADIEEIVGYVTKAQWKDGYLNSYFTLHEPENRFTNLRDMHELYCLGHLAEFAVAYRHLTGSNELIDVMRRAVDLVRKTVLPKGGYPGHQEIELGLLRLYELTGEEQFLDVAGFFVRERGKVDENGQTYYDRESIARGSDPYSWRGNETIAPPPFRFPRDYGYMQAHAPLVEQTSIEGHCVRAMYYLTGAAHYALLRPSETEDIKKAVLRLFNNTVNQKMYITGGLGSVARSEGFGPDYHLPDRPGDGGGCYCETCASFGLIILCERLLRQDLNGAYGDVMERAFLNCVLGAVALDGTSFYYENPLATIAGEPRPRSKWFDTSCCPPNVAKLMGILPSLAFSTRGSTIAIHLFISSTFTTTVNGKPVEVDVVTNLPWEGSVKLALRCQEEVQLAIRIPSWAGPAYTCSAAGLVKDGYLYVSARSSDIELSFSVEPKVIYPHLKTRKDEIAVMRGPLVYCAESPDNDFDLESTYVKPSVKEAGKLDIAGIKDVPLLELDATVKTATREDLYLAGCPHLKTESRQITMLPFFLRMNRGGNGAMRVWFKIDH